MEIDDQSQRYIEQFHVAEQLRLVNGMNRLDGFDFNEQAAFEDRRDGGNREIISVVSVASCSVQPHHVLNVP